MMTELEKMKRAKMYIDNLANGVDPISNTELENDNVLNNVRLARCFFYVSEVLGKVIANGGEVNSVNSKKRRNPFYITNEELQQVALSDTAIAVSALCRLIAVAIGDESRGKLSATKVADWLVNKEFLKVIPSADGKSKKVPTDAGRELGITVDHRTSVHGDYDVNLYDRQAQQFILDNLTAVLQEEFA